MQKTLIVAASELINNYGELASAERLSVMESAGREMSSALGQGVLGEWLTKPDATTPADSVACAGAEQAHDERRREALSIRLHGRLSYR